MWENSYKMLQHLKRRIWPGGRFHRQFDPTGVQLESCPVGQLQVELEELTNKVLQKAGVNPACVAVTVEHADTLQDRRPVLRSMIALTQWDPECAFRLLLGLAHIERAVRRALDASWVSDAAHFGGVWLHPTAAVLDSSGLKHLAAALGSLETNFKGRESIWSGAGTLQSSGRESSQSSGLRPYGRRQARGVP